MKTCLNFVAIGLAGSLSLGLLSARADLEVSASVSIHAQSDFYAPLSAQGQWIEVGSYGRCWHPASVAVGWRPYCYGHWEWTDCGWYWVSDEPWAWACYHYGSWVCDPVHSWVWVPGIEWAPAWVTWRTGAGYIGWAPLPPHRLTVAVAGPQFVFVEATRFQEPVRPSTVIANNTTIINKTTVINNIKRETRMVGGPQAQKVVVNEGPGVDAIQKASGRKVRAMPIQQVARQTPAPAHMLRGSDLGEKAKPSVAPSPVPEHSPSLYQKPGQPETVTPRDGASRRGKGTPAFSPKPQGEGKDREKPEEGQGKGKP